MAPLRTGVVSYLNALPLWVGLRGDPRFELFPDTPARLAERMASGELDLGLLPAVESLRQPEAAFFADLGVSAEGIVDSVGLFLRCPLGEVRTVALDDTSRTSAALTRVLLSDAGAQPEYLRRRVTSASLSRADEDAVLLIGDECLKARKAPSGRRWLDLASVWKETTGLPFVFALWTGRPEVMTRELHEILGEALARGLAQVGEMAEKASDLGRPEELVRYLRETIHHHLSPRAMDGFAEFVRRAEVLELLPAGSHASLPRRRR